MIEYFELENFMSYKDKTTLSFVATNKSKETNEANSNWYKEIDGKKLLKLVIGVGLNGTGKTKLIQSLAYLRRLVLVKPEQAIDKVEFKPFLLDNDSIHKDTKLWLSYYIDEKNYLYHVTISRDRIEHEELNLNSNGKWSAVYNRTYNNTQDIIDVNFGEVCDLNETDQEQLRKNLINNATLMSIFGSMNLESDILKINFNYFKEKISIVHRSPETLAERLSTGNPKHDNQIKKLIIQLMQDLGTNIVNYEIESNEINLSNLLNESKGNDPFVEWIKAQHLTETIESKTLKLIHHTSQIDKGLDLKNESLGTVNIIRLVVALYDIIVYHKFSCIDEVGNGIHLSALKFILKLYLLLSDDSQIFIATHDLSLLDSKRVIVELKMKNDALQKFSKGEDGSTTLKRFKYIHNSLNVYKKYLEELDKELQRFAEEENIYQKYIDIISMPRK